MRSNAVEYNPTHNVMVNHIGFYFYDVLFHFLLVHCDAYVMPQLFASRHRTHSNIKTDLRAAPDLGSGQDPGCALAKGEWIHHRQRHRTAKQSGLHDACEPHTTDDQRISL
jgi:hypothetical protein